MEVVDQTITKKILPKSIAQRVASNFGWLIVSQAVGKGIFFITNIYLARTLGVENFGLFTLAQAITFYLWLAVDLGTSMYGIREIANDKENVRVLINPLITMRVVAGVVMFSVYMLVLVVLNMPWQNKLVFAGCGLYLVSYAFYPDWVLKGLEEFKSVAYGSLTSSLAFLGGILGFVHGREDSTIAAVIWSGSYFLGSSLLHYFLVWKQGIQFRPAFNLATWWRHLQESLFFSLSAASILLYRYLAIIFLSIYFSKYEVGLFAAPYRILLAVTGIGSLIATSFYPVLSHLYSTDNLRFHKVRSLYLMLMLAIGLPLSFLGSTFSGSIVGALLGKDYFESIRAFATLAWLVPLCWCAHGLATSLSAMRLQRHAGIGSLCSTTVSYTHLTLPTKA